VQSTRTTKESLNAHKRSITIRELPKTFRDAIVITRRFGVQYLWIDSLCFIQDDPADWDYESSQMGSVYANSYLTIAASSSTDDEGGCFPSRVQGLRTYVSPDAQYSEIRDTRQEAVATAKVRLSDGRTSNVHLFAEWLQTGETGVIDELDPLLAEPLSSRAWTLQERILSPRTLHCGTDQLYFECGNGL
jgi:hypothetical protein